MYPRKKACPNFSLLLSECFKSHSSRRLPKQSRDALDLTSSKLAKGLEKELLPAFGGSHFLWESKNTLINLGKRESRICCWMTAHHQPLGFH